MLPLTSSFTRPALTSRQLKQKGSEGFPLSISCDNVQGWNMWWFGIPSMEKGCAVCGVGVRCTWRWVYLCSGMVLGCVSLLLVALVEHCLLSFD